HLFPRCRKGLLEHGGTDALGAVAAGTAARDRRLDQRGREFLEQLAQVVFHLRTATRYQLTQGCGVSFGHMRPDCENRLGQLSHLPMPGALRFSPSMSTSRESRLHESELR